MSKQVRPSNSPICKLKEQRPGPADYTSYQIHTSADRPLTSKKSFGVAQTFSRARKDKLIQYSPEYVKDYLNKLGPGPAAYSKIEMPIDDTFVMKPRKTSESLPRSASF